MKRGRKCKYYSKKLRREWVAEIRKSYVYSQVILRRGDEQKKLFNSLFPEVLHELSHDVVAYGTARCFINKGLLTRISPWED